MHMNRVAWNRIDSSQMVRKDETPAEQQMNLTAAEHSTEYYTIKARKRPRELGRDDLPKKKIVTEDQRKENRNNTRRTFQQGATATSLVPEATDSTRGFSA